MIRLYHYTCAHHMPQIRRDGYVRPAGHMLFPRPLAWFTDLYRPRRMALGLTSDLLDCDRCQWRFTVTEPVGITPYADLAETITPDRRRLIEGPGTAPAHWWVAFAPVPVAHPWRRL